MNKYFTVLQDNTLKRILVKEQETDEVLAIKSFELSGPKDTFIYKKVYRLFAHLWNKFESGYGYNWECIESEFEDNSTLGDKYCIDSSFETEGSAIQRMLKDGFTIIIDGVVMTN